MFGLFSPTPAKVRHTNVVGLGSSSARASPVSSLAGTSRASMLVPPLAATRTAAGFDRHLRISGSDYAGSESGLTRAATDLGAAGDDELDAAQPVCIAASNGDLLVADGRRLRLVGLRALEDAARRNAPSNWASSGSSSGAEPVADALSAVWRLRRLLKDVDFWTLETDAITFDVRHMAVAPNGRLVVVVGERELAVVALPMGRGQRRVGAGLPCLSYALGKTHHNARSSPVLKVEWHPLSDEGVHLAVLTEDGLLRLYDLGGNLAEPEQLIDLRARLGLDRRLQKSAATRSTFSAELDGADVATFAFGRSENGWSSLAAYVLMRNGDLYSVCPILPSRSRLRRAHVVTMLAQAERDRDELGFSDNEVQTSLLDREITWLAEVLKQAPTADSAADQSVKTGKQREDEETVDEGEGEDAFICLSSANIASVLPEPNARGPHLMQPAPWEVDGNITYACDLLCLPAEPADLVVIAYDNGKLDICLAADPPEPSTGVQFWEQDEIDLPCLVVHECLHVFQPHDTAGGAVAPVNYPRLLADPMYPELFYCYSEDGVYAIDSKLWLEQLQRWWAVDGDRDLNQADLPGSSVKNLLQSVSDSREFRQVHNLPTRAALCVVEDSVVNYSMMYLSSLEQLVLQELTPRTDVEAEVADDTHEISQTSLLHTDTAASSVAGTSTTDLPPSETKAYTTLLDTKGGSGTASPQPSLAALANDLQHSAAPRLVLPQDTLTGDGVEAMEAHVEQLKRIIGAYLMRMKSVQEAASYMKHRAEVQKQELARQRTMVNTLGRQITEEMNARLDATRVQVATLLKQQHALIRRADLLAHRAASHRDPTLSGRERAFFSELQGIEQKARQMLVHVNSMSNEIDAVRAGGPDSLRMSKTGAGSSSASAGLHRLDEVEGALQAESSMIGKAVDQLERLVTRVSSMGLGDPTTSSGGD
ncbi:hypothetical protein THASP1DRAFT_29684 [Thamnocephalis sphaerospora]|uniref:Uncharacterized protein n=1 Tax=Thamnocephalis sphaerospora TaxID=78915 RepID=A0A4P9XR31_9FUNG|nr:hypothetical protein THASP1DRAFT_29684 [Thamnocephalis sphaerospora]|eukprot:RKP08508.1 hypothetical protein THASP1DRAFT_29684 [Thamnocephalis sphaerospora]